MSDTGHSRKTTLLSGSYRRWIPLLALLLAISVGVGTAAAEDTESPEWGNATASTATQGNTTTIDVFLYDNEELDTATIDRDDFRVSMGQVVNISVSETSAGGENRNGTRVSLHLDSKLDTNNVSVSLRDNAKITDNASNKLPEKTITATGVDSVTPKYRSFKVTRINSSTAKISVETHEPLQDLRISVGGPDTDTLNISNFTEQTGNTVTYTRKYTFPEEGEYSLLLMQVTDTNGNVNRFGRQRTFLYDGTAPNVTIVGPEESKVGQPVNFSAANSTDERGIESIQWRLGRETILTGEQITVAFATPGSHEVVVEVTDPLGNTATVTKIVSVVGEGASGNVTMQRANATSVTASINGTGRPQRVQRSTGSLISGQNGALKWVDVTIPANSSAQMTVSARRPPAAFADAADHTAVARFDVEHGEEATEDATFTFTVDQTVVESAGATPEDVTLFRRQNGWTPLSTAVISRSESQVVYRADSPGLSTFVVGVENTTEPSETETPAPTASSGQPDIVLTNATSDPESLAPGDQIVVTAELQNRGTATGDHRVVVAVDGTMVTRRTVTVPAGETRTTEFVRSVPANSTGTLTVGGQRVANVTAASDGGSLLPSLPSLGVPNPLFLWPDGIVGTILSAVIGLIVGLYSVLKGLAIHLGY
ncbi:MAG: PKD domain-containing protein [Haloarcula sp.]